VLVENRSGASGNIGTAAVAASAPDGYTLLLGFDGTTVINPHVYARLPWDTLRELISLKQPFSYGTAGTGSTPHLAGELLAQRTGIALTHVPYKGGGQAMGEVVGGQIPLVYTAIASSS